MVHLGDSHWSLNTICVLCIEEFNTKLPRTSGSGENNLSQAPGGHYGLQTGAGGSLRSLVHAWFGELRRLSPKLACLHQAGTQEEGAEAGLQPEEWLDLA